ncbi:hypothetical protein SI65_01043 [Aspergillus cristatus]|uniref:Uncharacterized protein n=1 Tax=Aspergillus cristatus TaxID=573508 RepID=A0A1E3BR45_ASPCR|nr:hypothetical protein SI65_01043 [Aspergillus cristatus]
MSTPDQPQSQMSYLTYLNRIYLLQIFSNHYDLTHFPNQFVINTLATGGQILTDIFIIEAEAQRDPSRAQVLADGFRILYGIEFGCASDVLAVPRLAEIGNAYAGLQIMDCLGNGYEHMNEMIMKGWMEYLGERPAVLTGVSMDGA